MTTDPRCPECDRPVGIRSTYCMQCGAEYESPARVESDQDNTETPKSNDLSPNTGDQDGQHSSGFELTTWEQRLRMWVGPDGWIDNSLTIALSIGAGLLMGPLAGVIVALVTGSLWSLGIGIVVWLVATAYLANHRTVYGAVRDGCFGVASLLFILPICFIYWVSENPLNQLDVFFSFELLVSLVGIPLLIIGILSGRLQTKTTNRDLQS